MGRVWMVGTPCVIQQNHFFFAMASSGSWLVYPCQSGEVKRLLFVNRGGRWTSSQSHNMGGDERSRKNWAMEGCGLPFQVLLDSIQLTFE